MGVRGRADYRLALPSHSVPPPPPKPPTSPRLESVATAKFECDCVFIYGPNYGLSAIFARLSSGVGWGDVAGTCLCVCGSGEKKKKK